MPLYDLHTVGFWGLKNANITAAMCSFYAERSKIHRVGGGLAAPASHATVRGVRHTAVHGRLLKADWSGAVRYPAEFIEVG